VAVACKWMQRDDGADLPEGDIITVHLGPVGVVPCSRLALMRRVPLFVSKGGILNYIQMSDIARK
jgi:hypothetical protein